MTTTPRKEETFFLYFAWIILAIVVASFGGKAIFDTEGLPPITYLHHFHAVAMLSWFVLFAAQPTLIHFGKHRTHRLLGMASPIVVIIFFTFAIAISNVNWQRQGDPLIITANSVSLTLFAGLYVAAVAWRRHPKAHKRLMLYATIALLGPAFGRIPEMFDQSPLMALPMMLVAQFAPLVHDILIERRVHPATWIGLALSLAAIPVILGLSGSPEWAIFLETLVGAPSMKVGQ